MALRASKQGKQPTAGIAAGAQQRGTLKSTPTLSGSARGNAAASTGVDPRKAAQLRRKREIQGYLSKAHEAMDTSRLTMPPQDSAFYYYQQVIDRSPKNKEALFGLTKIANRYAYLADKELNRRDLEKAKRFIQRGLKVQGNNPKLNDLDTRISQLEQKERKVAEYLSAANRSLNSAKLTKPPKDNAYHYYQKVLKLSPGHKTARRGITRVADRYADLAEKEIEQYRYAKAKEYVNLGLGVQPKHPRLVGLKTRTNAVEDVPRRFFGKIKSIFD
jgi:tetratricopeptide (TPR) repeat protein